MIIIHINPVGVEKVYFQSDSDLAEDLCLAAWPVVRGELKRIDKKLKKIADSASKYYAIDSITIGRRSE